MNCLLAIVTFLDALYMLHKNFKSVSRCVFGNGCFDQLDDILAHLRLHSESYVVFIVDDFITKTALANRIPKLKQDLILPTNVDGHEPTTGEVDHLRDSILAFQDVLPVAVIGIGGGSIMDIAKAVALMLTNPGHAYEYQGLNLVKVPGVYHIGVPTLSGTGAEVSMTAVLTGPTKKLGLKSDYTVFDQIVLDPLLIADAQEPQRFYTGMDCYIHAVEALDGHKMNAFSRAYGLESLSLCRDVFLYQQENRLALDEKLMTASYFGGLSLTYSEVGACHALSYGLSFVLGTRHGVANCIVFNQLEEFYPQGFAEFQEMLEVNQVQIPKSIAPELSDDQVNRMVDVAFGLPFMWEHAIGKDWQKTITRERLAALYWKMQGA
jgi:3-deoxy-alpha-D-manno-octulosonate 8-oxidase